MVICGNAYCHFSQNPILTLLLALLLALCCKLPDEPPATAHQKNSVSQDNLQAIVAKAMDNRSGAVVVMDADGNILSLYNKDLADRDFPLGSIVKPFIAKSITERKYLCRGKYGRILCTHPKQTAPISLAQAIAISCNGYFASLAEELDLRSIEQSLRKYGFGNGHLLPGKQKEDFFIGEGGTVTLSPIALTRAMLTLALNHPPATYTNHDLDLPQEILEGLRGCIEYGTAANNDWKSLPQDLMVIGKTGSPTIPDDVITHGWFSAVVCRKGTADFAVTVFLKAGRGSEAAAIAADVITKFIQSASVTAESNDEISVAVFSSLQPKSANFSAKQLKLRDFQNRCLATTTQVTLSVVGADKLVARIAEGVEIPAVQLHLEAEHLRIRIEGAAERFYSTGMFTLRLDRESRSILIIEHTKLESYVASVVSTEIPEETEPEALKAQAVVARSYAVASPPRHKGYRFCDSTHCQRYVGQAAVAAMKAAKETAGEYLIDQGNRPVQALYHACCGGKLLTANRVWKASSEPSKLCGYCKGHPWQRKIPRSQLLSILGRHLGIEVKNTQLVLDENNACLRLELSTSEGKRILPCGILLELLADCPSLPTELRLINETVLIAGKGLGHCVGLCQHAAHTMAKQGRSYSEILSNFLPDLRLSRAILTRPVGNLQEKSTVYEIENLSISFFAPNTIVEAKEVASIALRAAAQLGKNAPGLRFEFVLHGSTASFCSVTGQGGDVAAVTVGTKIHLQPLHLCRLGSLRELVRHEMAHVAIDHVGGKSVARWLHEGYATIFAGEKYTSVRPTADLECRLVRARSNEERRQLYAEAATKVAELLAKTGERALWQALAAGRFRSQGCNSN